MFQYIRDNYYRLSIGAFFIAGILVLYSPLNAPVANALWHPLGSPKLALLINNRDSQLAFDLGQYYFNGGTYNLANAQTAYQRAIQIDPSSGHYQLARVYFAEGKFPDALAEINTEINMHPQNMQSFYVRGLIHMFSGNLSAAEQDFQIIVAWAPKIWGGYNDLSAVLLQEKKYQEAAAIAQKGIDTADRGATNAWLFNSLGVAYLNVGQYAKAVAALEKAKELSSSITLIEWINAYSGNDFSQAQNGLNQFKQSIETNLERALIFNR